MKVIGVKIRRNEDGDYKKYFVEHAGKSGSINFENNGYGIIFENGGDWSEKEQEEIRDFIYEDAMSTRTSSRFPIL